MRAAMQQLNPDAALLKRCLECHARWLRRQRAKLPPDVPAGPAALQEGPPAGAFSHRDATDAWHRLLRAVIYHGLFFLLTASKRMAAGTATVAAGTAARVPPFETCRCAASAQLPPALARRRGERRSPRLSHD
jgi:hypothetical protein